MKHRSPSFAVVVLLCLAAASLAGCGSAADAEPGTSTESPAEQAPATSAPAPAAPPTELAASHILIQYAGSARATTTRTKEEALELAREVALKAQAGEDFAALAREFSEGPTGSRGGNLGVFPVNQMVPAFSQATVALEIGEVSEPVETEFGYHIIVRNKVDKVNARHILIMHEGSERKPEEITRSRDEALARAEEVLAEIAAGGEFQELAREYSDGPSAPRGGDLGGFVREQMVEPFSEAAFALEIGGVSGVVETQFGFHIIQRY